MFPPKMNEKNQHTPKTLTLMSRSPESFAVGDEVEVVCQDEGFRGSLYEARIVRSTTKQRRYTIEYETLLSEADPAKNLRESVSAGYVRPRPPPICRSTFEIGEKVDAFHNDGWWAGDISKVLDGGKRYAVRFTDGDEGSKEELEYGLDEIRVHMDWIDGQWISPEVLVQDKLDIQHNLFGTEPEAIRKILHAISIAHEAQIPVQSLMLSGGANENCCTSHCSAPNLDSINRGESTLQVQLESSHPCEKSENGEVQDGVKVYDSLMLGKDVKSHCSVETAFGVTTPVIEERTDTHLQPLEENPHCTTSPIDQSRSFNSDLVMNTPIETLVEETNGDRLIYADISHQLPQHTLPCMVKPSIMGGKSTKLIVTGSVNQQTMANHDHSSNYPPEIAVQHPKKRAVAPPSREGKVSLYGGLRQSIAGEKETPKRGRPKKVKMTKNAAREKETPKSGRLKKVKLTNNAAAKEGIELKQLEEEHDVIAKMTGLERKIARQKGRPRKVRIVDTKESIEGIKPKQLESKEVAHQREHKNEEVDRADMNFNISPEIHCQMNGKTDGDNFRELRRESDKRDVEEANETSNGGCCTLQVETTTAKFSDSILGPVAKRTDIEDVTKIHCASEDEGQHDMDPRIPAGDQVPIGRGSEVRMIETDRTSDNCDSMKFLPFAKTSPMWKHIESSEVFLLMPQHPHFLPLKQYPEELREGTAIGFMVTFAKVVNKIMKLQIIDPNDTLHETMETLDHLELYGFNVQHLRASLKEIQIRKENQKKLLITRSTLEELISDRQNKKNELDAKFRLIDKVIIDLEHSLKYLHDERASILKQSKENDHEIIKLQQDKKAVEESSLAAECSLHSFLDALNYAQGSSTGTC